MPNYDLNGEIINKYIGKEVSIETLVGRNYYLYTSGEKDKEQPFELEISDLDLYVEENEDDEDFIDDDFDEDEFEDEDEDYNELKIFIPDKCWVKRISAVEDGHEAYYIVALSVGEDSKIENVKVLLEEVTQMGGGFFFIPGMDLGHTSSYYELDYLPDIIIKELDLLISGRALNNSFSFIGKPVPQAIIDNDTSGGKYSDYTFAIQSAYRLAYMHMTMDTDGERLIESFDYSTYQSTGSSYGDMFSRPRFLSAHKDEAIDMLLYILDQYTEEEFEKYK